METEERSAPEGSGGRWGERIGEVIGMVPLMAPLAAAGWYQADLAHSVFHWTYPFALVWPAAIEGGAAYTAHLYLRKLIAGHSTISTRLGMMTYAAASSALLWWHAIEVGHPWQAAAGIGGMTLAGVWLWVQRARWLRRRALQDRGLVDAQAPRFAAIRWLLCPIETPRAFRYGVRYGIQDPQRALEGVRVERKRRRLARALERARRRVRQQRAAERSSTPPVEGSAPPERAVEPEPEGVPAAAPAPVAVEGPPKARRNSGTRRKRSGRGDDAADLERLKQEYGSGVVPSLGEIQKALGCGVPKAQRLQRLIREGSTQESEAVAR